MAKKGEAHHGGAWKVAYADFVTAMMALFMVLWITAQDHEILIATAQYFKNPFNALTDRPIGVMKPKDAGSRGQDKNRETATAANLAFLRALAKELNKMLNIAEAVQEHPVDMEVTSDGLKITLYDRSAQPLFEKNTAEFTAWGKFVMQNLAWIVERNELKVVIDGHAASGMKLPNEKYGLWELTADRANAARRMLEYYAVNPDKIERVTGYAATHLLPSVPADSESNQRITMSLSPSFVVPRKEKN